MSKFLYAFLVIFAAQVSLGVALASDEGFSPSGEMQLPKIGTQFNFRRVHGVLGSKEDSKDGPLVHVILEAGLTGTSVKVEEVIPGTPGEKVLYPLSDLVLPLVVGKQWSGELVTHGIQGDLTRSYNYTVKGEEEFVVEASSERLKVFRIEGGGYYAQRSVETPDIARTPYTRTIWFSPKLGYYVRVDWSFRRSRYSFSLMEYVLP